jgi:hypothetical protein
LSCSAGTGKQVSGDEVFEVAHAQIVGTSSSDTAIGVR